MAYVVTQPCCGDASCVVACPVNCIHPAPGDPGFATAEMVHIDATACVGCGACVTACPVGAIVPDTALTPEQRPFVDLAADYFDVFPHRDRTPLALVPEQRRLRASGPFRVAVVGAGPAGIYTADELLRHPEVSVDVYDRLPVPHGLARFGVAPDHERTRAIGDLFEVISRQPGFRYRLGVAVGDGGDITHEELAARHDAVVYAVGSATDRALGVPGEDLRGSLAATDLVGWYNGHPERRDLDATMAALPPGARVVVVGVGNVALDIARVLTTLPDPVREVVLLGRRGPADAAFTTPELVGLAGFTDVSGVDVVVEGADPGAEGPGDGVRQRLLADLARRTPASPPRPKITIRFHARVERILGVEHAMGVRLDDGTEIAADLVVRAVGQQWAPVEHERGRVRPGVYVVGWAKRGPTGFLGTNKTDAQETVESILDELDGRAHDAGGGAAGYAAAQPGEALGA